MVSGNLVIRVKGNSIWVGRLIPPEITGIEKAILAGSENSSRFHLPQLYPTKDLDELDDGSQEVPSSHPQLLLSTGSLARQVAGKEGSLPFPPPQLCVGEKLAWTT